MWQFISYLRTISLKLLLLRTIISIMNIQEIVDLCKRRTKFTDHSSLRMLQPWNHINTRVEKAEDWINVAIFKLFMHNQFEIVHIYMIISVTYIQQIVDICRLVKISTKLTDHSSVRMLQPWNHTNTRMDKAEDCINVVAI